MKGFQREDDFLSRRHHLAGMTDEELKDYFWKKTEELIEPLLSLAYENTSPSIERSVLLRMGFSSIEAAQLVQMAIERELIGYGVGHVVFLAAREETLSLREAGLALMDGKFWDRCEELLKESDDETQA